MHDETSERNETDELDPRIIFSENEVLTVAYARSVRIQTTLLKYVSSSFYLKTCKQASELQFGILSLGERKLETGLIYAV